MQTPPAVNSAQVPAADGVPEIHAHEGQRRYRLIDLDDAAIERTAAELVEGSKLLSNRELWVANFRATIERVRRWCDQLKSQLRFGLVDVKSNRVLFYFIPHSERYDLELGNAMTALEVELGGSAGIGYVETLQVPERSLERFAGGGSRMFWSVDAAKV